MNQRANSLFDAATSGLLDELIRKYSTSGPRYTSYPTAVEFHGGIRNREWRECLAEDRTARASAPVNKGSQGAGTDAYSLYFHIPFCPSLCYFCACNKIITKDREVVAPYLDAVERELDTYQDLLGGNVPIEQIHWGGGSPNYLTPDQMARLHQAALQRFPNLLPSADVSLEVDPRQTSVEQLQTLAKLGFNRLSMGVQDFDTQVQKVVNRVQPFEMTERICTTARQSGFTGINIDLIYGLPLQTVDGFSRTVDQVLEIRPDRVALYGYAHVTWIKKAQKALERAYLPGPSERVAIFVDAIRKFIAAGYVHIGMDHFALPGDSLAQALEQGRLNRNFMGYTSHSGARLIGFGVSAISTLPGAFAQNTKDIELYKRQMLTDGLAIDRGYRKSREDTIRGEIIESLLCNGRLDIRRFEQFWNCEFETEFGEGVDRLREFSDDGLVTISPSAIELTEVGTVFARNVAMAFDGYLERHRSAEKPVFSQAV